MKKTIGILGGMGPEATVYMFNLLIKKTGVKKDQDHIRVVILSDPGVPPRTDAILGKGPSPVPYLVKGVKTLKGAGADFIIMPCVTAHYFIPEVKELVDFKLVSLVEESVKWAKLKVGGLKKAGIVASTGTLKSLLFSDAFGGAGIELIAPEGKAQEQYMEAIFGEAGIKAGYTEGLAREMILSCARKLIEQGAEAVIAGCTEVPLVLRDADIPVPLIEPMRITAEAGIKAAGYKVSRK